MGIAIKNCCVLSILATASVVGFAPASHAATLFAGSVEGIFGEPSTTASTNVFSGVGTNSFTTGSAFGSSTPNIFTVDGLSFSEEAGTPFAVAGLTYTNGVTTAGSTISSVPLDLAVNFTTPSGIEETTFGFTFDLNVTPNTTGDAVLDADSLSILDVASSTNFTVEGESFTLQLLGFSADAGSTIDNTFTLPEDATTEAQLFGVVTLSEPAVIPEIPPVASPVIPTVPTVPGDSSAAVPEPATILGSLVALGLSRVVRRKS